MIRAEVRPGREAGDGDPPGHRDVVDRRPEIDTGKACEDDAQKEEPDLKRAAKKLRNAGVFNFVEEKAPPEIRKFLQVTNFLNGGGSRGNNRPGVGVKIPIGGGKTRIGIGLPIKIGIGSKSPKASKPKSPKGGKIRTPINTRIPIRPKAPKKEDKPPAESDPPRRPIRPLPKPKSKPTIKTQPKSDSKTPTSVIK